MTITTGRGAAVSTSRHDLRLISSILLLGERKAEKYMVVGITRLGDIDVELTSAYSKSAISSLERSELTASLDEVPLFLSRPHDKLPAKMKFNCQ